MIEFCPHCKPDRKLNKAGRNKSGTQRYRCRGCNFSKSEGDRLQGSLPKYGAAALTPYECLKRHRLKKKQAELDA